MRLGHSDEMQSDKLTWSRSAFLNVSNKVVAMANGRIEEMEKWDESSKGQNNVESSAKNCSRAHGQSRQGGLLGWCFQWLVT